MTSSLLNPSVTEKIVIKEIQEANQEETLDSIKLYDLHNIENCHWPKNEEGEYARKFLTPLIRKGVSKYIENVQTDLQVLVWKELVLPISVNQKEYDNSYVCSPYNYYISYAQESLGLLTHSWILHSIHALLWGVSKVLRHFEVNKVVMVNNWFFSTNLYPTLTSEQLKKISEFLKDRFPDHALVFRSIDPHTNSLCYKSLQQMGFDYIAYRQIFSIQPRQSSLFETRLFKSDLKLFKNCGYELLNEDQLNEKDFSCLLNLYRDLYITKYSDLNPKFNEDFLRLLMTEKLMHFRVLKKGDHLHGVVGFVVRNGMMFCPFFGYDRSVPKEVALYRLLSTVLMMEAYERDLLFHQSSGASMFKSIRKAQACIEYLAVYTSHLKLRRKIPWFALKQMCNSLGIFYMKRY